MNRIYRLVWSRSKKAVIVVSENGKTQGKSKGKSATVTVGALLASGLLLAETALASTPPIAANTLPSGYQVTAGTAAVSSMGNTLNIQQSSARAAINWQSFSIGSNATVNFLQPNASAVVLNRVVGTEQTVISGALHANGQVFLLNSNGVLFTQGASVNTGGLVASTLNLSDTDFMAGRSTFTANGSQASVINMGTIKVSDGGYVALLGNQVLNEGVISARMGSAVLAAGDQISLNFNGNSLVGVKVDQATLNALVVNKQAIYADGGQVILTAKAVDNLLANVVNNSGEIRAQTVSNQAGKIYLLGEGGTVNVDGTLDASAPNGGNGGFIETSGAHVEIANSAKVTTAAAMGLTGSWLLDPVDFNIAATGGDITGSALGILLGSNSVTIQTATGSNSATNLYANGSTGTGNINVNDPVSWGANTTLTLNAYGNININQAITATGASGALALYYGQGAVNASNLATYNVNAPVNLMAGNNFSTKLGSDGSVVNYTVITSLGAAGDATSAPTTMTLQGMAATASLGGNYVLGSNIDASAISNFTPIGNVTNNFTGTFDGLGHFISNFTINLPSTNYVGLFGWSASGSVIKNIGLVGGSVSGGGIAVGGLVGLNYGTVSNSYSTVSVSGVSGGYGVGGLVGSNGNGGAISNSYATGNVSGGIYVGGLAGGSNYGTIDNSYATGSVHGASNVGGLAGVSTVSTISNSYATGSVSGSGNNVGGLLGVNNGTIINSYATGSVSGTSVIGGLVGNNNGATISNGYWDSSINATGIGSGSTTGATGLTTLQMQTASNFVGFSFTTTPGANGNNWVMVDATGTLNNSRGASDLGATFPMLASEYSTTINNAHQLQLMAMSLSANYTLGSNIDASNTVTSTSLNDVWSTTGGFVPVGDSITQFTGTFNGNNNTISGLTINRPLASSVGLFGITSAASVIRNVGVIGGSVSGATDVGGLVGVNYGTVSYSHFSGNVSGSGIVGNIGGLIGRNESGTVINSYSSGSVSGSGYVGGLVGANSYGISDSYSSSSVSGTGNIIGGLVGCNNAGTVSNSYSVGNVNGSQKVGGLVGYNNSGTVSNSYATGSVSGGSYVGGLVGHNNYGSVSNSHATGSVSGSSYVGYVGGLVGYNNGQISNSYATAGSVAGSVDVGGLVGYNYSSGTVNTSYATGSVSGRIYVGGLVGYNNGQISSSYATGSVVGSVRYVGGLAGTSFDTTISNSYATGSVSGGSYVGGLVGSLQGKAFTSTINDSYATGHVSGSSNVGGLAGGINSLANTSTTNSFYDNQTTGQTQGIGGIADVAGTVLGMSTADMKLQANFTSATAANGNVNPGWDYTTPVWRIVSSVNQGYPCLAYQSGCVAAPSTTTIYLDLLAGTSVYGSTPIFTYGYYTTATYGTGTQITDATPTGTIIWSGAPTSTSNVSGSPYSVSYGSGITLGNSGYTLVAGTAVSWTVNPLAVSIATISNASKIYDGTTSAAANLLTVANAINGDSVTLSGNAVLAGSNAGTESLASLTGLSLNNPNYTLTGGKTRGAVVVVPQESVVANTIIQVQPANSAQLRPDTITLLANQLGQQNPSGGQVNGFVNVVTPLPQISSTFGGNTQLAVISSPSPNELTQTVSLSQARDMMQPSNSTGSVSGGGQSVYVMSDVRVPVSRNSLVEIVNGGVKLPTGVEQELFVVKGN